MDEVLVLLLFRQLLGSCEDVTERDTRSLDGNTSILLFLHGVHVALARGSVIGDDATS